MKITALAPVGCILTAEPSQLWLWHAACFLSVVTINRGVRIRRLLSEQTRQVWSICSMLPNLLQGLEQFVEPVFEDEVESPTEALSLNDSPYFHVRQIRCRVRNGVARLDGYVPTYHQKQLAQEMVRRFPQVKTIHNQVVVNSHRYSIAPRI
jgi:hypothetical protein